MYNPFGGNKFSYSNFHSLNLDWIIEIAKNFLDQYSHIQEIITTGEQNIQDKTDEGLTALQDKADELKNLLNTWYDTHSSDIANELNTAIESFITTAQDIVDHAADSLPADYSEILEKVRVLSDYVNTGYYNGEYFFDFLQPIMENKGYGNDQSGNIVFGTQANRLVFTTPITTDKRIKINCSGLYRITVYTFNKRSIEGENRSNTETGSQYGTAVNIEPNTMFILQASKTDNSNILPSDFNNTNYEITYYESDEVESIKATSFPIDGAIGIYNLIGVNKTYGNDSAGIIQFSPQSNRVCMETPQIFNDRIFVEVLEDDLKCNVIMFNTGEIKGKNRSQTETGVFSVTKSMPYSIPANTWFIMVVSYTDNRDLSPAIFNSANIRITKVNEIDTSDITNITRYQNEVYAHPNGAVSTVPASANAGRMEPIPVKAGTTYYLSDVYGYFCAVIYDNGTRASFTEEQRVRYGTFFTAAYDGVMLISFSTTADVNPEFFSGGDNHTYYVDTNGYGEFTTITDMVNECTKYKNSKVFVRDGYFDLIAEYGDNIETAGAGLILKNGISIKFSSRAKLFCHYQGSNYDVRHEFSVFNAGPYGFTLENVNISCSNIRYAIHDERGGSMDEYTNKYINCIMQLNNSNNPDGYSQVIGGGLGKSGYIEIEGGTYKTFANNSDAISYHNSPNSDAESHIHIKNVYVDGTNSIRFSWHGISQRISTMIITGCSLGKAIVHRAETESSTVENTQIIAWNNIIR